MPKFSRYADEPLDLTSRRSIAIQPDRLGGPLIESADSHVIVNYLFHEGCYWKARIPLDGVEEVLGQAFNFSRPRSRRGRSGPEIVRDRRGVPKRTIPMLNHIQTRIRLKPDHLAELYPLKSESLDVPVHRIRDIIYSFEAVGPVSVGFNLRDAMLGNLIGAHRFLSIQEMVFERVVLENQYVSESPPLPLSNREKRAVLTESLLRSHHAGVSERYYLYRLFRTNNCISTPFHILDKVMKYRLVHRIGAMFYRLPISPRFYLRVRGLDSDPSVRKLLRDEFIDYINTDSVQKRKRDHEQNGS